jgi:hypothetical protein
LRVLILTWEFPPKIVGELALYVGRVAAELVRKKIDVYVVTHDESRAGLDQRQDGLKVFRASNPVKTHISVLTWDLTLAAEFERASSDVIYSTARIVSLIDAHEWLCVIPAIALKKAFDIPFVYSVHSIEDQRSRGATSPFNLAIANVERYGCDEAERILVKSAEMRDELKARYGVSSSKIDVVQPTSDTWIDDIVKVYEKAIRTPLQDFWRLVEA